jgi:hypothetical protein
MISASNAPLNIASSDADFTVEHYRTLLELAKKNYSFASYCDIPWGQRFVLWRHDVDYSLNRSLALAKLEHEAGVCATYFVNPHSEFYNLAESHQVQLIQDILCLGHSIGLHFDAAFYEMQDEASLHEHISAEADMLERLLGVRPEVFSFHNPVAAHLSCDAPIYGGLINCYSQRFKTEIAYCSDSNGYWRFRRLSDVLTAATDVCLQVLTHPGWWQEWPMPPRQRIFRCAYGRARATMLQYDASLKSHGRLNHSGLVDAFGFLQARCPGQFELLDYLFNQGALDALFLEMWRLHELQISRLCEAQLTVAWQVPEVEVAASLDIAALRLDGADVFELVFERSWHSVFASDNARRDKWRRMRDQLVKGRTSQQADALDAGCLYLAGIIDAFARWGMAQPLAYDGLAPLVATVHESLGEVSTENWAQLRKVLENLSLKERR